MVIFCWIGGRHRGGRRSCVGGAASSRRHLAAAAVDVLSLLLVPLLHAAASDQRRRHEASALKAGTTCFVYSFRILPRMRGGAARFASNFGDWAGARGGLGLGGTSLVTHRPGRQRLHAIVSAMSMPGNSGAAASSIDAGTYATGDSWRFLRFHQHASCGSASASRAGGYAPELALRELRRAARDALQRTHRIHR